MCGCTPNCGRYRNGRNSVQQHQEKMVPLTDTAPQHLVCRVMQSLHNNPMEMSMIEVSVCGRLHTCI